MLYTCMFPFTVIITISFLQQLDCTGPVLFYRGMKGNPCAVLITSLYVCLTNSTEGPLLYQVQLQEFSSSITGQRPFWHYFQCNRKVTLKLMSKRVSSVLISRPMNISQRMLIYDKCIFKFQNFTFMNTYLLTINQN